MKKSPTKTECCDICSKQITHDEACECLECHNLFCEQCGYDETCNECIVGEFEN